jgi:cytochrome o ubiquinol oxidase subunit IV
MSTSSNKTTKSYVAGFVLSLIFTFLAYYSVVNNMFTGKALLATILGLAVAQMATQLFFFLHLGRGPKPAYNIVFLAGTVGLILVVVLGSIFIMYNLQYNMAPSEVTQRLSQDEAISQLNGIETGACQGLGLNHKVTIKDGRINPAVTSAKLCDTFTFINEDSKAREITFGPHPGHQAYGGNLEVAVRKNISKTITLNQPGTFTFHDHLDPTTSGQFTVSK